MTHEETAQRRIYCVAPSARRLCILPDHHPGLRAVPSPCQRVPGPTAPLHRLVSSRPRRLRVPPLPVATLAKLVRTRPNGLTSREPNLEELVSCLLREKAFVLIRFQFTASMLMPYRWLWPRRHGVKPSSMYCCPYTTSRLFIWTLLFSEPQGHHIVATHWLARTSAMTIIGHADDQVLGVLVSSEGVLSAPFDAFCAAAGPS